MTTRQPAQVFPVDEYIQDELTARGWTREQLAEKMVWPKRAVVDLIKGKRPLMPKMAAALGWAFGTSADVWLNLDRNYREWRRCNDRND